MLNRMLKQGPVRNEIVLINYKELLEERGISGMYIQKLIYVIFFFSYYYIYHKILPTLN